MDIDEKQRTGSVIITAQYPVSKWYQRLSDPTIADALCDRLIHKSYTFELGGNSIRKKDKKSTRQTKA